MDDLLRKALDNLSPADCSYTEWLNVGMALKQEGYTYDVWDNWSRDDARYHAGDCEKKWNTFNGSSDPVTAGTIIKLAQGKGWNPSYTGFDRNGILDWNSTIEYDGFDYKAESEEKPTEQLARYISTLFSSEEHVCYVTSDVWQNKDGKWLPREGTYYKTAGDMLETLKSHPDDIEYTIETVRPEAGAWIRFNPVDGKGVKNENVTRFRYALVESDTLSLQEQEFIYRKLQLPIACMVYSGGKSIHAIVKVDAADAAEYKKRVAYLYDSLKKQGIDIDEQNKNPSRLSRMPGVMRNGKLQRLIDTDIGCTSWASWVDFIEGEADDLPPIETLPDSFDDLPPMPEPLIEGILRKGHKMLISGPSKAGKSFLLMELAVDLAEGRKWLGFQCKKCKVLYINFEIEGSSCMHRFADIYDALGIYNRSKDNLHIWNLRGHARKLEELVPKVNRQAKMNHYGAIIFDPIYKIIMGDENNASDMGNFCNQFDKICDATGAAAIYCHHHSKGAQGGKKSQDRASGSGVFARDPDAQLDIIPLQMTYDFINKVRDSNDIPFRMESSLREFPNITPVNFWFRHPLHVLDDTGSLNELAEEGSAEGNLAKSGKRNTPADKLEEIESVYTLLTSASNNDYITLQELAEYEGKDITTVRKWVRDSSVSEHFGVDNGKLFRKQ